MQSILAITTILIIVVSLMEIRVPFAELLLPNAEGCQWQVCQALDRVVLDALCKADG